MSSKTIKTIKEELHKKMPFTEGAEEVVSDILDSIPDWMMAFNDSAKELPPYDAYTADKVLSVAGSGNALAWVNRLTITPETVEFSASQPTDETKLVWVDIASPDWNIYQRSNGTESWDGLAITGKLRDPSFHTQPFNNNDTFDIAAQYPHLRKLQPILFFSIDGNKHSIKIKPNLTGSKKVLLNAQNIANTADPQGYITLDEYKMFFLAQTFDEVTATAGDTYIIPLDAEALPKNNATAAWNSVVTDADINNIVLPESESDIQLFSGTNTEGEDVAGVVTPEGDRFYFQKTQQAVGGVDDWNASASYVERDLVKYGTELYIALQSNSNITPISSAQNWQKIGATYCEEYSIAADAFSGLNGGWADYVNLPLAGNEILLMADAGTFDFNQDGNPITVKAGDKLQYQYVEWVNISDTQINSEDAEVTLIDVDAANGTTYQFSTGETWAQIKQNYDRLIFTGNASRSGTPQIRPWSFVLDLGAGLDALTQSGYRMDFTNDYSVTIYADTPQDTHTGLTYRQSGGDAPTGGRMQFTVKAVKKQKLFVPAEETTPFVPTKLNIALSNDGGNTDTRGNLPASHPETGKLLSKIEMVFGDRRKDFSSNTRKVTTTFTASQIAAFTNQGNGWFKGTRDLTMPDASPYPVELFFFTDGSAPLADTDINMGVSVQDDHAGQRNTYGRVWRMTAFYE